VEFGAKPCPREHSIVELGRTEIPAENCSLFNGPTSGPIVHVFGNAEMANGPKSEVNGIAVVSLRAPAGQLRYQIPAFGEEVDLSGPPASRIIDTLTASPRAVLWTKTPAASSLWKTIVFDGLSARVPASWPVQQTDETDYLFPCGSNGVWSGSSDVLVDTDRNDVSYSCPMEWPGQPWSVSAPVDHLAIGPPVVGSTAKCVHSNGLDVCALAGTGSVLYLQVGEPRGRTAAVTISLAGDGLVARTIMGSLRPAPASEPTFGTAPAPA
jgi:hypothetical protein